MKKIIALISAFIMLFTLVACNLNSKTRHDFNDNDGIIIDGEIIDEITKKKYNVNFETNGGSKIKSITTYEIEEIPYTSKKGHLFDGWYLDPTLTVGATFPLEVNKNITLYAKWLKVEDTVKCNGGHIKGSGNYSSSIRYNVSPNGFDMERLENLGYNLRIDVSYDVYYVKDYDIPLDVGYFGGPGYEVSIEGEDGYGTHENDVPAPKSKETKTISYASTIANIKKENLKLTFSTDNIQNIVYFENIVITYTCY